MTEPLSVRRPEPVQPRTRSREIERKDADDRDDFETALADEGDDGDGTRAAQDMLAQGSVVQPMPVRIASFDPPLGLEMGTGSPLEQAVHSLLDQMQSVITDITNTAASPSQRIATIALDDLDDSTEDDGFLPEGMATTDVKHAGPAPAAKGPVATTAVREPEPLPENENPSHMHLVLDDGDQRIVVTVAVRGDQVNAMVRGDEQTAAALARNAAALDHALHAKGLDLESFTAERDLAQDQRQQEQREHDEAADEARPAFRMENLV